MGRSPATTGAEAGIRREVLRGAEAPLLHGCAGVVAETGWVGSAGEIRRSLAALGMTTSGELVG